jgi:predicted PurR-regulated permease PerM
MDKKKLALATPRIAFLLPLAIGITLLLLWVVKDFLLAILIAAVLAGLAHPFYRRVEKLLGGRKSLAAGATVLLSIILVIVPALLLFGILVGQAVDVAESAASWIQTQVEQSDDLRRQIEEDPDLRQLLPYQDKILEKAGRLAANLGSFVAQGLAAGAKGTATFVLMLFVTLLGMFFFLVEGQGILDTVLRFTPLTREDKTSLLGTFSSVGRATIKGTAIIGVIQGSLAGLSFWVAGIQGVVFWAAVMTVLSVLPGIGATLVWIPAVVFLALNGQIGAAVGVGLWCALVVGTIDNVLRPLLVGKETKMPDLLVMVTTLGGLALFGFAGLLVGPIIGALFMTVWRLWGSAYEEARGDVAAVATTDRGAG